MRFNIRVFVIVLSFGLSSCNEWLDLQPEDSATEEQIFSTGSGYRSVLNGLYQSMGEADLYGREMTWGIVDCISQQYNFDKQDITCGDKLYPNIGAFKYTDNTVVSRIELLWRSAYNVIANANNVIQNIENESPDLFTKGEMERRMIMGEAYACRALMHFDLLRLFAPALINDDNGNYIPYVDKYPDIQANGIGVNDFLKKVIADLELARTLVVNYDTSEMGKYVSSTAKARFQNMLESDMVIDANDKDDFFMGRGFRLSYYSITALLARVYQYAGNHEKAFEMAQEVLNFEIAGSKNVYQLYSDNFTNYTQVAIEDRRDLKLTSSLIFAVYNDDAYNALNLNNYYRLEKGNSTVNWLVLNYDKQGVFKMDNGADEYDTDIRGALMTMLAEGQYYLSGKWYLSEYSEVRNLNAAIIPVIRLTEMRYIVAEYYARQGNFSMATEILSEIRQLRRAENIINVTDWASFEKELIRDARREWIAEGQLFYLYKRLNAKVNFVNEERPLQRSEYLLPIPSNQSL